MQNDREFADQRPISSETLTALDRAVADMLLRGNTTTLETLVGAEFTARFKAAFQPEMDKWEQEILCGVPGGTEPTGILRWKG